MLGGHVRHRDIEGFSYEEIAKILGIDQKHNMIIIGAGNLGQAIANYTNFEKSQEMT